MAVALTVPSVGESITEVEIGEWLKPEGASARQDEPVVVIETEKATLEIPAPVTGKVTQVLKKQGDHAAVGEVVGYMEQGDGAPQQQPPQQQPPQPAPQQPPQKPLENAPLPATRPAPPPPARNDFGRGEHTVPMSAIRRRIGERLVEAQQNAALLTTFNEIEMSAVAELRERH